MPNNFIARIDTIGGGTDWLAPSQTIGFATNGIDSNSGTPEQPRKNLNSTTMSGRIIGVLGNDQVYTFNSGVIPAGNHTYFGNGMAILDGESINTLRNDPQQLGFEDCYIRRFLPIQFATTVGIRAVKRCVFENNASIVIVSANTAPNSTSELVDNISSNFFKSQDVKISQNVSGRAIGRTSRNIFFSSSRNTLEIELSANSFAGVVDSNVFMNQDIICRQDQIERFENNYFENCTFTIDGIVYNDIPSLLSAIPTAIPNYVENNANFSGNLFFNEKDIVDIDSSLLGSGKLGSNIGDVNIGFNFNSLAPSTLVNAQFVAGVLSRVNTNQEGVCAFSTVTFPRVFRSPKLIMNGIPDYVNNVFSVQQVPQPDLPKKLTVEISFAGIGSGIGQPEIFAVDFNLFLQADGKYSGEDDYHEIDIQDINIERMDLTIRIN